MASLHILGKVKLCLLNDHFNLAVELLQRICDRIIFIRLSILQLNPYTNLIMFVKKGTIDKAQKTSEMVGNKVEYQILHGTSLYVQHLLSLIANCC